MKRVLFILTVVLTLFAVSCQPAAKKADTAVEPEAAVVDPNVITKLVIASDATWPPMEFVNDAKEIVGFDIDMINALGQYMGIEIEVRNTAWDGIFAGLDNGAYDAIVSSVTITEERMKAMDFSTPYINAGQVLVVSKKLADTGITTLAQMSGKKVGAQIGTTGAGEISKVAGVTLKTYDELGLAVEDLAIGRIDGIVADAPTAADFVLSNEKYKAIMTIVGEPFTDEYYGIVVKKGNTQVLDLINAGLKKLTDYGRLDPIKAKWSLK